MGSLLFRHGVARTRHLDSLTIWRSRIARPGPPEVEVGPLSEIQTPGNPKFRGERFLTLDGKPRDLLPASPFSISKEQSSISL